MEKSLQATITESLRRIPRKRKSSKSRGLWRESRPFSCRSEGSVLENSTACVYVEATSLVDVVENETCLHPSGWDFEHKLKVTKDWPVYRPPFFTESLILAQDERWRRA